MPKFSDISVETLIQRFGQGGNFREMWSTSKGGPLPGSGWEGGGGGGGGGGLLAKFHSVRLLPEVQPLNLLYPFFF